MNKTYFCTQYFDFGAGDPKMAGFVFHIHRDTKTIGATKADWWIDAPRTPPLTLWSADWNGECWTKVLIHPWNKDSWTPVNGFRAWPVYEVTSDDSYEIVGVVIA